MSAIRRREFIAGLGSAATSTAIWPLDARAQQRSIPVAGILGIGGERANNFPANEIDAFLAGLNAMGYVVGKNVAFEFRWTEQFHQLAALAAELVRRPVAVIYTIANANAAQAAKAATTSIPIVFTLGADPVRLGFVASLGRPGGNATDVSFFGTALGPKSLELLRELVPQAAMIAVLVNPTSATTDTSLNDLKAAAISIGQHISVLGAGNMDEIDTAFAAMAGQGARALLVNGDALFFARRERPADLPVQQSTKIELVINMKTARALGLTFPINLLGRADEVIE